MRVPVSSRQRIGHHALTLWMWRGREGEEDSGGGGVNLVIQSDLFDSVVYGTAATEREQGMEDGMGDLARERERTWANGVSV